ncbi:MAG: DUF6734 family protein [Bacteroidota bacterium]
MKSRNLKIVHSYWTKPNLKDGDTNTWDRKAGGWVDKKFNYMSWALSCLQFREYYDQVELVTDQAGAALLIDKLGLPYTRVQVILDELNDYHPDLWAMGKLLAYRAQEEPFIHADGDIFVWGAFGQRIEEASLVAQHLEDDYPFYRDVLAEIDEHFDYVPEVIAQRWQQGHIKASNAGVFGGNQLEFFQDYTAEALKFIDRNLEHVGKVTTGLFNCIYEQFLFHAMAEQQDIPVQYYTKNIDHQFKGLVQFDGVPTKTKYIHPVGFYKKFSKIGNHLAYRLRKDHPEYYFRIMNLIKNFEI